MIKYTMKCHSLRTMFALLMFLYCSSCEKNASLPAQDSNATLSSEDHLVQKLTQKTTTQSVSDVISGTPNTATPAGFFDGSIPTDNINSNDSTYTAATSVLTEIDAEDALRDLEDTAAYHQKNIDKLRKIIFIKDEKVLSLKQQNASLEKRVNSLQDQIEKLKLQSEFDRFKEEKELINVKVEGLKGKFSEKADYISALDEQSKSLSVKLDNSREQSSPEFTEDFIKFVDPSDISQKTSSESSLQFDAVVTSLNGKSKEAFYTEFFILEKDLEQLLLSKKLNLSDFPKISSFSELFARARKTPFSYPEVLKKIRAALLEEVSNNRGIRVRTDINGSASVSNLQPSTYFIIGSASLGKVGVTWNLPVELDAESNKVSLTLSNASWSE